MDIFILILIFLKTKNTEIKTDYNCVRKLDFTKRQPLADRDGESVHGQRNADEKYLPKLHILLSPIQNRYPKIIPK